MPLAFTRFDHISPGSASTQVVITEAYWVVNDDGTMTDAIILDIPVDIDADGPTIADAVNGAVIQNAADNGVTITAAQILTSDQFTRQG